MSTVAKRSQELLRVSHVQFTRGDFVVLEDVSFSIKEGEYVGIIGPNGGGKTTLLNILLGLERQTAGKIEWEGRELRHQVGYVPQHAASFDPLFPATVEEMVASGRVALRKWYQGPRAHDVVRIEKAMETCGISHLAKRRIGEISGGERQRAFLARALAGEPRILVLDEPMSAVDEYQQQTLYDVLRELHRRTHMTILMVSHDLHAVEREATRVLCLNKRIVSHGSYADHPHMH
ncbi:ABC transporter ATP-binding protein [bacterium]|nr:ABC transporter ATP-binding protein [bacterium]NBX49206.1 ABC transporter ATP-binding protein [bacterium]